MSGTNRTNNGPVRSIFILQPYSVYVRYNRLVTATKGSQLHATLTTRLAWDCQSRPPAFIRIQRNTHSRWNELLFSIFIILNLLNFNPICKLLCSLLVRKYVVAACFGQLCARRAGGQPYFEAARNRENSVFAILCVLRRSHTAKINRNRFKSK